MIALEFMVEWAFSPNIIDVDIIGIIGIIDIINLINSVLLEMLCIPIPPQNIFESN
jgi:hypothetical protein